MSDPLPAPSPEFSAQMVLELAAKIHEPEDILARYGLDAEAFAKLAATSAFKQAYREAKAFWESDANVRERISTKAAVLLEDSLLDLHAIVTSREMAAGARLQAFGHLANLAKVDGGEKAMAPGASAGSITINIDMGAATFTTEAPLPAIDGELVEDVDENQD